VIAFADRSMPQLSPLHSDGILPSKTSTNA